MRRARLSDLPESVRSFLIDSLEGDGLILEDDLGHPQGSLLPLRTQPMLRKDEEAQIPVWPGIVTSSLHREEIYADV
jgi:hypothetical protein